MHLHAEQATARRAVEADHPAVDEAESEPEPGPAPRYAICLGRQR